MPLYQALSGNSQPAAAPSGSPGPGAAPSLYKGLQIPPQSPAQQQAAQLPSVSQQGMQQLIGQSSPMSANADNTTNGLQLGPMTASNDNRPQPTPQPLPPSAGVTPAGVQQSEMQKVLQSYNRAR